MQVLQRGLYFANLGLAFLFAAALLLLTLRPAAVERQVREEIVRRVMSAAAERYPGLSKPGWSSGIIAKARSGAAEIRARRDSPEIDVAAALIGSTLCRRACGDQANIARGLREMLSDQVRQLDTVVERVQEWAQGQFAELFDELIADLKIFAATNAVLCLMAAAAARVARAHHRLLLCLSGTLMVTALFGAWSYVYGQNWLGTILFGNYFGYAYVVYVAVMFAIFADLIFNGARVVTALLDGATQALLY